MKTHRTWKTTSIFLLGLSFCTASAFANEKTTSSHSTELNSLDSIATPELIIDDITCRGNRTTDCAFITNKYFQEIGDVLDNDEIADARLRLGTLIQLRAVDIYLEKGQRRGHVVVVFDVTEASNLFYEVGIGYDTTEVRSLPGFEDSNPRYGVNAKVTNFNFLGTGKELSLKVEAAREESTLNSPINAVYQVNNQEYYIRTGQLNWQRNSTDYTLELSYFDPHLLGSSHYYFAASLEFQKSHIRSEGSEIWDQPPPENYPFSDGPEFFSFSGNESYHTQSILFGRRFGRHSYVAIDAKSYTANHISDSYGITYGWNSEDDIILPTTGSAFSIRATRQSGEAQGHFHYRKNVSIRPDEVLSFGTNVTYNDHNQDCNACSLLHEDSLSGSVFARYTNIDVIDKQNGKYASWYIGAQYGQGNIGEDYYNYEFSSLSAGYTWQSDSIIYRLSLALNYQEND